MKDPLPYQIYEDVAGVQFVLIKAQAAGLWTALKLVPLCLVLLSPSNLARLTLIGRATWER